MELTKIREDLRKAGVYVAEGDPVLELAAICEVALGDTIKTVERVTKQQADRVTAASTQIVVDAKAAAEMIVNAAGHWAETRIKTAGEAAAASVLLTLKQETVKAERACGAAIRIAWIVAILALVVLSGMGGMVLAIFTRR
jgi:glycine/D-amino acid oxidase-like deaminating enzyme